MLASTMQFSKNNPTPTPPRIRSSDIREEQPHTPQPPPDSEKPDKDHEAACSLTTQ